VDGLIDFDFDFGVATAREHRAGGDDAEHEGRLTMVTPLKERVRGLAPLFDELFDELETLEEFHATTVIDLTDARADLRSFVEHFVAEARAIGPRIMSGDPLTLETDQHLRDRLDDLSNAATKIIEASRAARARVVEGQA
jgi:hypothetical protein